MSTESTEVKLARMEERLNTVLGGLQQDRESRKQQYDTLEDIGRSLLLIDNRVQSVEKRLTEAGPTIDEFITIKHKVVGAGVLGKWIWAIGASLITILYTSREAILAWMAK